MTRLEPVVDQLCSGDPCPTCGTAGTTSTVHTRHESTTHSDGWYILADATGWTTQLSYSRCPWTLSQYVDRIPLSRSDDADDSYRTEYHEIEINVDSDTEADAEEFRGRMEEFVESVNSPQTLQPGPTAASDGTDTISGGSESDDSREVCPGNYCENWMAECEKHDTDGNRVDGGHWR